MSFVTIILTSKKGLEK